MEITKAEIIKQFKRAQDLGWIRFFENAAASITNGYFDAADLLGIGSRETNLDPKWLTKLGDGGNAGGLLQADVRSFPYFVKSGKWKDAETGINFGAEVLMNKWTDFEASVGKRRTVKSSKGKTYNYTGKEASGVVAQNIVISSYNCGRWSQYAYANSQNIDKYSTHGNYGLDVMQRAAIFRQLLKDSAAPIITTTITGAFNPNLLTPNIPQESAYQPPDSGDQSSDIDADQTTAQTNAETGSLDNSTDTPKKDDPVTVPQVTAEPQDKQEVSGIKASFAAAAAFITSTFGGLISLFAGVGAEIVYGFFGAAAVIGTVFVIVRFWFVNKENQRTHDSQMQREQRAHEVQMATIKAAADPNLNTVKVVPVPLKNSDTENKL